MRKGTSRALRSAVAASLLTLVLAGCSPNSSVDRQSTKGQGPSSAPSELPQPTATADQWLSAVGGVFDKVNVQKLRDKKKLEYVLDEGKTDANGVTEFFGCFDKSPPQCDAPVSGKRDGFRKVQFFFEPVWNWKESGYKYVNGVGKPSVRGYISLIDCRRPKIVLEPTFRASTWIFLEQFSLMLDGTVVLDRKFGTGEIDRENDHNSVVETAHLTVDERELLMLRKVDPSKQILIRLTGQKGYVGLDPEMSITFAQGIAKLLHLYDALDQATLKVGPVKDAACPA